MIKNISLVGVTELWGTFSSYYFHCCLYCSECALLPDHFLAKLFPGIGGIFMKIQVGRRDCPSFVPY